MTIFNQGKLRKSLVETFSYLYRAILEQDLKKLFFIWHNFCYL